MFWEEGIFCRKPRSHEQIPQNHPAPAGAKVISRRRYPHGEFALQCSALHCDKEKTQRKAQTGIKPLSALPCCRGLHSEACANTCQEQRVKANLLHDPIDRNGRAFFSFFSPASKKRTPFPLFQTKGEALLFYQKQFLLPLKQKKLLFLQSPIDFLSFSC